MTNIINKYEIIICHNHLQTKSSFSFLYFVFAKPCVFFTLLLSLSFDKVLKLELKEIREQQDLLFRYMNFLKQEGAVHVLQFCLAVGMYVCTCKKKKNQSTMK